MAITVPVQLQHIGTGTARDLQEQQGVKDPNYHGFRRCIGYGQAKRTQTTLPPALPHARKHVQHIFSLYFLCDKHLNGIMLVHRVLR
jgi:hypothetical protein